MSLIINPNEKIKKPLDPNLVALVMKSYEPALKGVLCHADLKRSLKDHPRRKDFIIQISYQLSGYKGKLTLDKIENVTKQVLQNVADTVENMHKNAKEAYYKEKEQSEIKQLADQLDSNGNGTIEELGVTIVDREPDKIGSRIIIKE